MSTLNSNKINVEVRLPSAIPLAMEAEGGAAAIVSVDARLAVSGAPLVTVGKNATGIQTMNFPSGSGSGASQNITCIFPEAVVIDSRFRVNGTLKIKVSMTIPANGAGANLPVGTAIRFGDQIAPRANCLHKGWSVAQLTTGNVDSTWSPMWAQVVDHFTDDATSQQFRQHASRTAMFKDNQAGYGSVNDVMAGLANSVAMHPGNGSAKMMFLDASGNPLADGATLSMAGGVGVWTYSASQNALVNTTANVQVNAVQTLSFYVGITASEVLNFGGCDFGPLRSAQKAGFARIQRANLSFTYDNDAARVLCLRDGSLGQDPTPAFATIWSATYLPGIGQSAFSMDVTTLLPAMNVELPATVYHPSFKILPTNPATGNTATPPWTTNGGNILAPFTQQLIASPMTLSRVPTHIILYVRPAQGIYASTEAMWTMPITGVELQYANQTLLSNASPEWLYEETIRSGVSNKSWAEFSGFIQASASGNALAVGGLIPSSGGIIALRPGHSFPLPAESTPGSLYQTTISAKVTYFNQTATPVTAELVMIFVDAIQIAADKGFAREFAPMLDPATIAAAEPTGIEHPHLVGGGMDAFHCRGRSQMGTAQDESVRPNAKFMSQAMPYLQKTGGSMGYGTSGSGVGGSGAASLGSKRARIIGAVEGGVGSN